MPRTAALAPLPDPWEEMGPKGCYRKGWGLAVAALVVERASVSRHGFLLGESTVGARQHGRHDNRTHGSLVPGGPGAQICLTLAGKVRHQVDRTSLEL
jgi:hypothetical protein